MIVLVALMLGTVLARLAGWLSQWAYLDSWPKAIAVGLAVMFTMTGIAHFVPGRRRDMIAIVPPRLPAPGALVTVTGLLELLGVVGLLLPPTRTAAAAALFVLMLAMFPANVRAARMPNPPKSMTSRLSVRSGEEVIYLAAAVVVAVCGG
jgi:uncharacterized membrane protein